MCRYHLVWLGRSDTIVRLTKVFWIFPTKRQIAWQEFRFPRTLSLKYLISLIVGDVTRYYCKMNGRVGSYAARDGPRDFHLNSMDVSKLEDEFVLLITHKYRLPDFRPW
jgi:hypothetical protein